MEKKQHILGFARRRSGAFEHSFGLAKNLSKRGYDSKFYSCWWENDPVEIDIKTEETHPFEKERLENIDGVIHLQTHTWEHRGFLDKMLKGKKKNLIYGLHAIIPYYHMNEKDKIPFLEGKLSKSYLNNLIDNLSEREKAQLKAIEKSDYLITISKNHKKALEKFGVTTPTYVFENVSDFYDLPKEVINESNKKAIELKESLNKENVLIYCGRLYPKKGANCLFDSFKKIKKEYSSSHLILLGTTEDMKGEMKNYGLNDEIINSVSFVPWFEKNKTESVKGLLKYFLASDVLIQPMITPELYSKSVIDAMTIGLPTITCKSPYSIGSSENGDAVFNSFVKFKENPKETQNIIEKAKEKVKLENTWDSYISRLEKIVK